MRITLEYRGTEYVRLRHRDQDYRVRADGTISPHPSSPALTQRLLDRATAIQATPR